MTPEERTKAEAWARWAAERDGDADVGVGGWALTLQQFPPPSTEGLTPTEAEAAVAAWRAKVADWVHETNRPFHSPIGKLSVPVRPVAAPPEVPTS